MPHIYFHVVDSTNYNTFAPDKCLALPSLHYKVTNICYGQH